MALPSPTYTFTIPSIHDDTNLSCRIYHPPKLLHASSTCPWSKRGAIVAHPYGPLGGTFDDPIVHLVGVELLRAGFVVATFNFRGAGDSGGRASWTARPELADYVSLYGFMIHYLHALEPKSSSEPFLESSESSDANSTPSQSTPPSHKGTEELEHPDTVLVLGGYSYGSMITAHLPPVEVVLDTFKSVVVGSAEAEILLRATNLSTRSNKELEARSQRRGRSLEVSNAFRNSPNCRAVGGSSSEHDSRRSSRESRRSMDSLRRGLSKRVGSKCDGNQDQAEVVEKLPCKDIHTPEIRYLLISPILPPISSFTTLFSKITFTPREGSTASRRKITCDDFDVKLTTRPTLAIYGDQDFFTSCRKLRKWCEGLACKQNSSFRFEELGGAGHFWSEAGVASQMKAIVRDWLKKSA